MYEYLIQFTNDSTFLMNFQFLKRLLSCNVTRI